MVHSHRALWIAGLLAVIVLIGASLPFTLGVLGEEAEDAIPPDKVGQLNFELTELAEAKAAVEAGATLEPGAIATIAGSCPEDYRWGELQYFKGFGPVATHVFAANFVLLESDEDVIGVYAGEVANASPGAILVRTGSLDPCADEFRVPTYETFVVPGDVAAVELTNVDGDVVTYREIDGIAAGTFNWRTHEFGDLATATVEPAVIATVVGAE